MAKLTAAQMTPELPLAIPRNRSRYSRKEQRLMLILTERELGLSQELLNSQERFACYQLRQKLIAALSRKNVR